MKKHKYLRLLMIILAMILASAWGLDLCRQNPLLIKRRRVLKYPLAGTENFSVIVLPDTQNYLAKPDNEHLFQKQIEWIIRNRDRLNIRFVIHVGDIVHNYDDDSQWRSADRMFSLLDERQIPYSVAVGNHEHENNDTRSPAPGFDRYFGVNRFKDKPWWGGLYKDSTNHYHLLSINGEDYVFLSLDWCPSGDEVQWAKDVLLKQYPQRKAVLTTHGYLDDTTATRAGVHGCDSTEYIFEDLVRHVPNLQIVLSGHEHEDDGESFRTDKNLAGNPVYQIMTDFQNEPNGGNGRLLILRFVPEEDKIYLKTYSPYKKQLQN